MMQRNSNNRRPTWMIWLLMWCCSVLAQRDAIAQQESTDVEFPVEIAKAKIQVFDAERHPVEKAKATLYAMRCKEDRGSHYGWPENNMKVPTELYTDQDGILEVPYPVVFGKPNQWLTTCQLSFLLEHSDFVTKDYHINLGSELHELAMERGCSIRCTAVDSENQPISELFPWINSTASWTYREAEIACKGLMAGKSHMFLVSPHPDGTLFSDPLSIDCRQDQPLEFNRIVLRRGRTVRGQLPDDIPRPVVDGKVFVCVAPNIDGDNNGDMFGRLYWEDWTKIKEDGSFEFKSLPTNSKLQLIAICKGWVTPSKNAGNKTGLLFDLNEDPSVFEPEIEMVQTGSVRVELVDLDGNSISGAIVTTWPNRFTVGNFSTLLTIESSSLEGLVKVKSGKRNQGWPALEFGPYRQKTDEEGIATLYDIPPGISEQLSVSHPKYDLPKSGESVRRDFQYTVTSGETLERILILEPIESQKDDE